MEFKILMTGVILIVLVSSGCIGGGEPQKPAPRVDFNIVIVDYDVDTSFFGGNARYTGKGVITNVGNVGAENVIVKVRLSDDPNIVYSFTGGGVVTVGIGYLSPEDSKTFDFYVEGPKDDAKRYEPYASVCGYTSKGGSRPCT